MVKVCDPTENAFVTSAAMTCTVSPAPMVRPPVSMVTDELPPTKVGQLLDDSFVVTSVTV